MKTKEYNIRNKSRNSGFKKKLAIGLAAVGVISMSSFTLFGLGINEVDKRVEDQHDYVEVTDNIEMSEYDLKKLEKYAKKHDGELPFDPVLTEDDEEVSLSDVLEEENSKLGKAPNEKYW
jgi:hypothetical protein